MPEVLAYAGQPDSNARRGAISRLREAVFAFWFKPTGPGTLGFCRALFYALMFWWHWDFDIAIWGTLTPAFANNRVFLWQLFGISVASAKTLAMLEFAWKGALLLSCVGLFTRFNTTVSFWLALYVLGVPHQFGKTGHGDGILMLTMLILSLSRCGDAWSVDAARLRKLDPLAMHRISGEYRWPIRMVWLLMSMIFVAAGVTKLRWSGLKWITTDNLANTILQHYYGSLSNPPTQLGRRVAEIKWLCRVIAGVTILLELSFPLAMVSRRIRWIVVPGMFVAQVGIYLMMGVAFTQFMFVYLFWVPWGWIGHKLRATTARRARS